MMKISFIDVFTIVALMYSSSAFAQRDFLRIKPLKFSSEIQLFQAHSEYGLVEKKNVFELDKFSRPIEGAVHYDAFFCKMEVKFEHQFNFWMKVHAGDYDRYSRYINPY